MKCTLREWQQLPKPLHEFIVQASAIDGSDSWQIWPIGMGADFVSYKHLVEKVYSGSHSKHSCVALSQALTMREDHEV